MAVRFKDLGLTRIRDQLGKFLRGSIKIGFIGDPELATIAAVQEFGSAAKNIPARSFMRSALEQARTEIAKAHARIIGRLMEGKINAQRAAEELGEFIRQAIIKRIDTAQSWAVPLAAATAAAKGHSRPLRDSDAMRNGLVVEVVL